MANLGERQEKMEQTSFYISLQDKIELEKLSELLGITQSEMIRNAIKSYIPKLREEVAKLKVG